MGETKQLPAGVQKHLRTDICLQDIKRKAALIGEADEVDAFWVLNRYAAGSYSDPEQTEELIMLLEEVERGCHAVRRVFVLATEEKEFSSLAGLIAGAWKSERVSAPAEVLLPFPYGMTPKVNLCLVSHVDEGSLHRLDPMLSSAVVRSLMLFRAANPALANFWHRRTVASVTVSIKRRGHNRSNACDILSGKEKILFIIEA